MANISAGAADLTVRWSYHAGCSRGEDLQVSQGSCHEAHGGGQSVQSTQCKQNFLGQKKEKGTIRSVKTEQTESSSLSLSFHSDGSRCLWIHANLLTPGVILSARADQILAMDGSAGVRYVNFTVRRHMQVGQQGTAVILPELQKR